MRGMSSGFVELNGAVRAYAINRRLNRLCPNRRADNQRFC